MSSHALKLAVAIAFATGLAATASAQAPAGGVPATPGGGAQEPAEISALNAGVPAHPTWETSAGYQVLHAPEETFPVGLNVDGARNWGPLGLVADLGWAWKSESSVTSNVFNFGAGPRWSGPRDRRAWPFAQVIVGGVFARTSLDAAGQSFTTSKTRFMVQPGVGVGVVAGDGWGIFGQVDYRRVFLKESEDGASGENEFRVYVGVRLLLD
jgi:hypothetical protein